MAQEPKYDLSIGNDALWNALGIRHPGLSPAERQVLGNNVLTRVSNSLRSGDILASLRPDSSGNLELVTWDIGPLDKGGR